MKTLFARAAQIALAAAIASAPLVAQLRDNTEKQLSCQDGNNNGDQARHCDIREQTFPAIGSLTVDAGRNGGVTVKGSFRSDVLVRSRVEASADTQAAAAAIATQISIDGSGGQVRAIGPSSSNNDGWSVSYEIFVPQSTNLTLTAHNGGVRITDVRGQIHFEVNNGGVQLKRLAGDVSGSTVNGGIQVDLTGGIWEGRQLEVSTRNGGVNISMPAFYSARVQAETSGGSIHSDFPMPPADAATRVRRVEMNVGSGGPLVHITTNNGSIAIKKAEAQ
jgi:DUF4097 and DUF4098 domain-containing protein YvlB